MKKETLPAIRAQSIITFRVGIVGVLVSLAVFMASTAEADREESADGPWKQYKNEDGVIGYERDVQRSKYVETRAETVIDAPIEVLLALLEDIPSYPLWMYKCMEAIPLGQEGELKRVLYFAQGVPLGSPDRDAVIEAITVADYDKGALVTTLHSIDHHPYQYPKKENDRIRQRMIEFSGMWDFQMIDRNRTKVIYTAYTNPGGFAPGFIVNGVIRKVSFRSLKGMILKAKEQKYIEVAKKSETKKKIEAAIQKGKLVFAASPQRTGASSPQ
ncbi:MAG: SRPBCC family protein [Desulfobacteraceae bacterium]|jgi:hypothetical protein